VLRRCVPSYISKAVFLTKKENMAAIIQDLVNANATLRSDLVPKFAEVYAEVIRNAPQHLGELFNSDDYPPPEELPDLFFMDWNRINFAANDDLPAELQKIEAERFENKMRDASDKIVWALRDGFGKLVDHLVERLKVEPGAKAKTFQKGTIENIKEFIAAFNDRNGIALNDEGLAELVKKAEGVLKFVTPEGIRDSVQLRQRTAEQFATIKQDIDKMIVERPVREFDFSEDEA